MRRKDEQRAVWYVVPRHGNGTASICKHLTKVGLSGSTGYSTCQSIPVKFADVLRSGVPTAGQAVTSANG